MLQGAWLSPACTRRTGEAIRLKNMIKVARNENLLFMMEFL
jgi:hypothetical protein